MYRDEVFCKITHYETLARDADLIDAWAPDLVIADEAQRIKNWNTIAARALKRIASPYAIVLTGTPLENRLEELISIVQFVDRHRLGPTWRLLDEHQKRDEAGRVIGYHGLDHIGQTLAPVMLRRRKAEVLTQLPERVDNRIFVPLTPQQRVHHDDNGDIVTRIVSRWRKTGYLSDSDQKRLHCALQNMRMACNSTWLLDQRNRPRAQGRRADDGARRTVRRPGRQGRGLQPVAGHARADPAPPGQRPAASATGAMCCSAATCRATQRGALVERFHDDPRCRLFLSTDAGGVGLNLQHAAAVVVNMDLPWNPAVLEQRIGRVHRMGQSRGVQVINFVGQGSIEEGMLSVLAFKKSLFAGVLDGGESEIFLQGTKLSQFMKSVEQVAGAMGEADVDPEEAPPSAPGAVRTPADPASTQGDALPIAEPQIDPVPSAAAGTEAPDPWAAMLEAGAALLQGLATARSASGAAPGAAPFAIERDPVTGQASVRLPLPEPAVLHRLAKALEPWLRH